MKKRIIAFIMVLSLMMLASVPSSGAETGTGTSAQPPLENTDASLLPDDQALSESPADTAAAGTVSADTVESPGEKAASELTDEQVQEFTDKLKEIDVAQLLDNVTLIKNIAESEEFRHLMQYPEMQALVLAALDKAELFVLENPELTGEILLKLGADEKITNTIVAFAQSAGEELKAGGAGPYAVSEQDGGPE